MNKRALMACLALAAILHAATYLGSGPFDDDFIVFRYAHNWIEGHGLAFNPGERSEGFTVPLWVFVIGAALKLGIPAAVASTCISILAAGVATFALGELWQFARPSSRTFAPALLLASSSAFAWNAVAGLGTTLLGALITLAVWLHVRAVQRASSALGAAILFGLAGSLRAEAVLFALPFLVCELARRRASIALLAFVPLAAWTVFRRAYYGRWLPIPYELKKLPLRDDLAYGVRYLFESTTTTAIVVLIVLTIVWLVRTRKNSTSRASSRSVALSAAAIGLLLHTAYVVYVGGDFMPLARFFIPAFPIALLFGALGFVELAPGRPRLLAAASLLAFVALAWPEIGVRPYVFQRHADEEARWEKLGRAFKTHVAPGMSVALAPIGAFGFYSELPIVDMLGLTNDAILHAEPDLRITMKGHHRQDANWVLAQKPAIVILGNGQLDFGENGRPRLVVSVWEQTLAAHPDFQRDYLPMKIDIAGSYPLIFYLRRGAPLPSGATLT